VSGQYPADHDVGPVAQPAQVDADSPINDEVVIHRAGATA